MNRIHATGLRARTFLMDNGTVRTGTHTTSALDTFVRINMGTPIYHGNCTFRTDFHTRMFQTSLTSFRHQHPVLRAGMTGKFDNINQRRLIIFFFHQAGLHTLRNFGMFRNLSQGKSHGYPQTLSNYRSLEKDALTIRSYLSRYNLIGQLVQTAAVSALICHSGNFCKNFVANLRFG